MRVGHRTSAALMVVFSASTASKLDLVAADLKLLDVKGSIRQPAIHESEVFRHAIRIITSLESAPSCHRLAARTLLDSCQSLETSKNSELNVALDQVKSLFAARLAVCELTGAHAAVPTQCLSMIPKPSAAADQGIRCLLPGSNCEWVKDESAGPRYNFESIDQQQIKQCLNTLESRPQWWTSYSNARQNAVVMCGAARSEIDREQLLEAHKTMVKVSSEISEGISEASGKYSQYLKAQEAFALYIKRLQKSIIGEMEAAERQARGFWRDTINQMEAFVGNAFVIFSQSANTASDTVEDLNNRLKNSVTEADNMQDTIRSSMQTFSLHEKALADAQQQTSQLSQESALALHNSLHTVQTQQVEPLEVALRDLRTMIDAQMQLMQLMFAKQGTVDARLDTFNQTIFNLQSRAASAEESLRYHVEAQSLLFEKLAINMAASNELASSIKSSLEDVGKGLATSILGFINPLRGFSSSWPAFASVVAFLSYLLLGPQVARRVTAAGLALFALGFLYEQLSLFGRYVAELQIRSLHPGPVQVTKVFILSVVGATVIAFMAIAGVLKFSKRRARKVTEQGDFFGDALAVRKRTASILPAYTI